MQATDKTQDGHSGRKPLGHDESARKVGTSHELWRKGLEKAAISRRSRHSDATPSHSELGGTNKQTQMSMQPLLMGRSAHGQQNKLMQRKAIACG
jgi:hypothetical protein